MAAGPGLGDAMMARDRAGVLEGLCVAGERAGDRVVLGVAVPGLERSAARFAGRAYAPHRHDTYGIGITTQGVQGFRYRGVARRSGAGQLHVLHPDELHDGNAGGGEGFGYRILHVDPALIRAALPAGALPFVADPVPPGVSVPGVLWAALARLDEGLDEAGRVEVVVAVGDLLRRLAGGGPGRGRLDLAAPGRVRAAIGDDPAAGLSMARLERMAGMDRWMLARQFRAAFGVSVRGFRTGRQVALARGLMARGMAVAEAAAAAGFADQSHMTRMFGRAVGVAPGRWRGLVGGGHPLDASARGAGAGAASSPPPRPSPAARERG